jgi:hypothetical protein
MVMSIVFSFSSGRIQYLYAVYRAARTGASRFLIDFGSDVMQKRRPVRKTARSIWTEKAATTIPRQSAAE